MMATEWADRTEHGALPRAARLLAHLIPSAEREAILGDLIEDAEHRGLRGPRRAAWLAGECAVIAGGLSVERVRASIVMPPVREVVAGLAIDGRGLLRHPAGGTFLRALVFVGSVATLVLGVEVLVGSLMSAAGF
jgi:hypothetical protein